MNIRFTDEKITDIKADLEIIFIINQDLDHRWVKKQQPLLRRLGFKSEHEEKIALHESSRVFVAIDSIRSENIRLAAAAAVRDLKGDYKTVKIGLYLDIKDKAGSVEALCEGLLLGEYRFETYKSKKKENRIEEVFISRSEYSMKKIETREAEEAIRRAVHTAGVINQVRDIINTPPEDATPERVAEIAAGLASEQEVSCQVYDEKWIREAGMGAFFAVGKASENPPRLIHLTYTPASPRAKVALVGKGITYDTGGLSLKPTSSMTSMKADKSGAVTVMGIILAAAGLKLDVEIHAILGAAENMVSGSSYRPDDILTTKHGKTIEVKNTDAEGRLVLADCLCYAQELEPDYIVDMATLTGACVMALGEYTFGVMGHSEDLKNSIIRAARASGELAHTLPFNSHLKKLLKSDVADIPNIASTRYGGASTAGLFLSEFVDDPYRDKWVHLDIAGPAFVEKPWGCNPGGASGVGVRTMLTWLKELSR